MTLEQLKQILDDGGTIVHNELPTQISKHIEGLGYRIGSSHFDWKEVESILNAPSEWQEVKAEIPENVQMALDTYRQTPIQFVRSNSDKPFAPRMIVVDVREWDALQGELEELRAFKARHDTTFDAPTEYKGMGHTRRLANLFNSADPDWKSILHSGKILIDEIGNTIYKQRACFTYYFDGVEPNGSNNRAYENWEECLEYMNQSKGWKIKDQ
jgi:hypothetical protein